MPQAPRSISTSLMIAAIIASIPVGLPAQTTSPFAGTWKLNLAKSKYDPGPAPMSSTVKIEAIESGERAAVDQIDSQSRATHSEFTAKFDGKEYPVEGDPNQDSVSNRKIDDYSFETTRKKDGRVTVINVTVVSRDGRVRTVTTTGTNARGQKVNNVVVFDKQ